MPILTKPSSVSKGSPATISVDKNQLKSVSVVDADTYWKDSSNWKSIILVYSNTFGQKEILILDASQTSPSKPFLVSSKARADFKLNSITLVDEDNSRFKIKRSSLTANATDAAFDVSFEAPVASSALITGDFTNGMPSGWTYQAGSPFATLGYASFSSGTQVGSVVGSSILQPLTEYKVRLHLVSVDSGVGISVYIGGTAPYFTTEQLASSVGSYYEFNTTTSSNIAGNWEVLINSSASGTVNISKIEIFDI